MSARRRRSIALAALLTACTAPTGHAPIAPAPPLRLDVQAPAEAFPGARFDVAGDGFLWGSAGETVVWFDGTLDGRPIAFPWPPLEVGPRRIRLGLTPAVLEVLPLPAGRLMGRLRVELHPADQPGARRRGAAALDLVLRATPKPTLTAVDPGPIAPGEGLIVSGADLVDGDEGRMMLELAGRFVPNDPSRPVRPLPAVRRPLVERRGRTQGVFASPADAFGLTPGEFEGRARLVLEGPSSAVTPWLDHVSITTVDPELPPPPPSTLRRGTSIRLETRGALPLDAAAQTSTLVHLVGEHRTLDGARTPVDAWWVPEDIDPGRSFRLALRTRIAAETGASPALVGPPWWPGTFTGMLSVTLRVGREAVTSLAVPFSLTLAPEAQAVFIDVRPGFADGLARFGLEAAAPAIIDRVLAVCARDFSGLRVSCSASPPGDALEFVTVELGGQDPNGRNLFGLETSPRKDVDNRRLDERIGGRDPETEAFGGVFVSSFLALSPGAPDPSPLAGPAFDIVFAPFSPEISPDAVPFDPAVDGPGTNRATLADEAVRVLGSLIGSTVTHELGHALGLSAATDGVHNPGDWPGDLMDAGEYRPLAERAEFGGHPPARFTGPNARALERILGEP